MARSKTTPIDLEAATAQLTPNRGGDFVQGDMSLGDGIPQADTLQGNHGATGNGGDAERADHDDYKVTGRARPSQK